MTKAGSRRTRVQQGRGRPSKTEHLTHDEGPDEAVALIAEGVADLSGLARRHRLDMLSYLLGMAQLEAEEHLRLRSPHRLS